VVLACPLTAETRRIINAQTLALLKKGAGLINVARGGVCDEQAVIAALRSGQIACAHLDVFETEPLPADSPLWDMPNLILTPHNASASAGNDRRSAEMFLLNLEKWAKGEALLNPHSARRKVSRPGQRTHGFAALRYLLRRSTMADNFLRRIDFDRRRSSRSVAGIAAGSVERH
jgi:phosphoglycerate dehydrogenase-like enzyme